MSDEEIKPRHIQDLITNDFSLDELSIMTSIEEVEELKDFVRQVAYDPLAVKDKVKKLLLLYAAAVKFMIQALDHSDYPEDIGLIVHCDNLAKTLYTLYKDLNVILLVREIESIWKKYLKLKALGKKLSSYSSTKNVQPNKERILLKLDHVCERIKVI